MSTEESIKDGSPQASAPPTLRSLLIMSGLALLVAAILLVIVVLPAEVGWDPTGIGGALGLAALGNMDPDLSDAPVGSHFSADRPLKAETLVVPLAPEEEMELKFVMKEGATLLYSWHTDGASIYSDLHADPIGGLDGGDHRYREDESTTGGRGSITAPYTGNHGWYWHNRTAEPVVVTLEVQGYYAVVKETRAPGT